MYLAMSPSAHDHDIAICFWDASVTLLGGLMWKAFILDATTILNYC